MVGSSSSDNSSLKIRVYGRILKLLQSRASLVEIATIMWVYIKDTETVSKDRS